ncbi:MAG: hypothetical protein AAF399_10320 [Bacteroidota bacterium]
MKYTWSWFLLLLIGLGMLLSAAKAPVVLVCPDVPPLMSQANCIQGLENGVWSLQLSAEEAIRLEVFNAEKELVLKREERAKNGAVGLSFSLSRYPEGTYEVLVHFPAETVTYSLFQAHP